MMTSFDRVEWYTCFSFTAIIAYKCEKHEALYIVSRVSVDRTRNKTSRKKNQIFWWNRIESAKRSRQVMLKQMMIFCRVCCCCWLEPFQAIDSTRKYSIPPPEIEIRNCSHTLRLIEWKKNCYEIISFFCASFILSGFRNDILLQKKSQ